MEEDHGVASTQAVLEKGRGLDEGSPRSISGIGVLQGNEAKEEEEDVLALLATVSSEDFQFQVQSEEQRNAAIQDGTAKRLIGILKDRLFTRTEMEDDNAIQSSILSRVADLVLRCHDDVLENNVQDFQDDLCVCLPKLIEVFQTKKSCRSSTTNREESVCLVALSCSVKLIQRVGRFVPWYLVRFAQSLISLLGRTPQADIRVDAVVAIAMFLQWERPEDKGEVARQVEGDASELISILSTAALSAADANDVEDIFRALLNIAHCSILSPKFRIRRCGVLAICRQLGSKSRRTRQLSLQICETFLSKPNNPEAHPVLDGNLDFMGVSLIKYVLGEEDVELHIQVIHILGHAICTKCLSARRTSEMMQALFTISTNAEGQEAAVTEASLCYLQGASRAEGCPAILKNIAEFVTSPFPKVRSTALQLLSDISFWNPAALIAQMEECHMLENFCTIISDGSDGDCTATMQICRQLADEETSHDIFCAHTPFLKAVLSLLTANPVKNRPAYINAVEVIIHLMEHDKRLPCFFPIADLLPWLATFANRTSNEEMKGQIVSAMIRFATAKLSTVINTYN